METLHISDCIFVPLLLNEFMVLSLDVTSALCHTFFLLLYSKSRLLSVLEDHKKKTIYKKNCNFFVC